MKPIVQFDHPWLINPLLALDWQVKSLTWALPGGADSAQLEAELPNAADEDWLAWLNSGLWITSPAGLPLWNGKIEQVVVYTAGSRRVISGKDLVNRVKVRYQRTGFRAEDGDLWLETDWQQNSTSLQRYGRREKILVLGQASLSQALSAGSWLLNRQAFPTDLPLLSQRSEKPRVEITAKGGWHSLGWVIDEETTGRIAHLAGGKSRLTLGAETGNSKLALSFLVSEADFCLGEAGLRVSLVGAPLDDLVLEVTTDAGNQPGTVLASLPLPAAEMNGSWTWIKWMFDPALVLNQGVCYWLVLRRSGAMDPLNHYLVESDDGPGYADGLCKYWQGGSWQQINQSVRFVVLALSPLPALVRTLSQPQRGGQFLSGVRVNVPQEKTALRWRESGLTCAERLRTWLDNTSGDGLMVSAVVNHQSALDVFCLPRWPQFVMRVRPDGGLQDPHTLNGDLLYAPLGRVVFFQRRKWVVKAVRWTAQRGFWVESWFEIKPTIQD